MLLIIPSIPIVHGVCGAQIASRAHETHHAGIVGDARGIVGDAIYSQNPVDRARLFRKENAKMLHLQFLDRDAWDESGLALIRALREAVDVPFGVSQPDGMPTELGCERMFEAGIHRVFLPECTPETLLFAYVKRFTPRKIVAMLDPSFDFESRLPVFREHGIERVGVDISRSDRLETGTIDWDRLKEIASLATRSGIRLTALHGVRGYPELKRLQALEPAFDSLILCRALNENRFPCQLIWREVEAEAAFETTPANNLWSNPLEGVPHI